MTIDYNLIATIFFGTLPFAVGTISYIYKLDKQISVMRNDIQWLKIKSCQRREQLNEAFADEP